MGLLMARAPTVSSLSTDIARTPIGRLVRKVDHRYGARHRARNLASAILTADPLTAGLTADEFLPGMTADLLRIPYRRSLFVGMEAVLQGFHPTAIFILV